MNCLVVTGHGHFADGIHTSAQMIAERDGCIAATSTLKRV